MEHIAFTLISWRVAWVISCGVAGCRQSTALSQLVGSNAPFDDAIEPGKTWLHLVYDDSCGGRMVAIFQRDAQHQDIGLADVDDSGGIGFRDGGADIADFLGFLTYFENGDLRADVNYDGGVDINDLNLFLASFYAGAYVPESRIMYAGYAHDPLDDPYSGQRGLYHVRHRVYSPERGRWHESDPLRLVDGMNVYEYARSTPVVAVDPYGTLTEIVGSTGSCASPVCWHTKGPSSQIVAGLTIGTPFGPIEIAPNWNPVELIPMPIGEVPCFLPARIPGSANGTTANYFTYDDCGFGNPQTQRCVCGVERRPGIPPNRPNGCGSGWVSKIPIWVVSKYGRALFGACCDNHDMCYGACGANTLQCDSNCLDCMEATCNGTYPRGRGIGARISRTLCL